MKYRGKCTACGDVIDFNYSKVLTEAETNKLATLKCRSIHIEAGQAYGACVYCGQYSSFSFSSRLTQNERNKAATKMCRCAEAQYFAQLEDKIDSAKERINMLFGDNAKNYGFKPLDKIESIELLNFIAEQIAKIRVQSATIQLIGGSKAKISFTSKGNIKIERTEINKQQLEE